MKKKFINLDKKTHKIKKVNKNGKLETVNNVLFTISNKTKKNLNKEKLKEINNRIATTYIPKHLNNIQIAESPHNRVQIIGQDDKGRQQYFYAKEYNNKSESRKYKALKNLSLIIQNLEKENVKKCLTIYKKLIKNKHYELTKQETIELINYFLLYHHIRIGNKQYLDKYNSTGISTLKKNHFKFYNNNHSNNKHINQNVEKCIIKFKGKKGVINNCIITYKGNDNMTYNVNLNNNSNNNNNDNGKNKVNIKQNELINLKDIHNKDIHYYLYKIFSILSSRKAKNEFMFDYTYHNPITNSHGRSIIDTNDYKNYFLDKYKIDITPKMFRTWFANYYLINYFVLNNSQILIDHKSCKKKSDKKKYQSRLKNDIIQQISNNLNNTPEICKSKYINHKFLCKVLSRLEYYCKKCSTLKNNNHLLQRRNIHKFLIKEIF